MRIGELARAVGVSTSAIRYYEQVGLLEPAVRGASGYREYTPADEQRLRMIVQARMLSIPLDEVRDLVGLAAGGRCRTARAELQTALRRRLDQTRRQLRELRVLQRELQAMCAHLEAEVAEDPSAMDSARPADECACLDTPAPSHRAERIDDRSETTREEDVT